MNSIVGNVLLYFWIPRNVRMSCYLGLLSKWICGTEKQASFVVGTDQGADMIGLEMLTDDVSNLGYRPESPEAQ